MSGIRPYRLLFALALACSTAGFAHGQSSIVKPQTIPAWKAVFGRIETRDSVPARARIGGIVTDLTVTEGDVVQAGDVIATVKDEKIAFQIKSVDAQLSGLKASLDNAQAELARSEKLIANGVSTAQRTDALRTQVDVVRNQIAAAEAQRSVIVEQSKEGSVLAATSGTVISVPVTKGAVIMAGETIATIGGGGFFLRLAIPERHAAQLTAQSKIEIVGSDSTTTATGTLVKIYPEIDNGRVIADVDVPDLKTGFVNARMLVRVPVGSRQALLVPSAAVQSRFGLDFVQVKSGDAVSDRAVITAPPVMMDGQPMTEIITGLAAGDEVVFP